MNRIGTCVAAACVIGLFCAFSCIYEITPAFQAANESAAADHTPVFDKNQQQRTTKSSAVVITNTIAMDTQAVLLEISHHEDTPDQRVRSRTDIQQQRKQHRTRAASGGKSALPMSVTDHFPISDQMYTDKPFLVPLRIESIAIDPSPLDPWWRRRHPQHEDLVARSPVFPRAGGVVTHLSVQCLRKAFGLGRDLDRKIYSQFGEDGILEEIFACIGTTNKFYVEFGVEDGRERSTRWLAEGHNFTGLLMDMTHRNAEINLHAEIITAETVDTLLHKHSAPHPAPDHMTIDLDLNTWHVAAAVLRGGWRPRSLSIEMNCNFLPHQSYVAPYYRDLYWQTSCYYGASPLAVERLVSFFGYDLVATDGRGINMFFVHNMALGAGHPSVHKTTKPRLRPLHKVWPILHPPCPGQQWIKVSELVDFNRWDPSQSETVQLNHWDRDDWFRVFYEVPYQTPERQIDKDLAMAEFARYQGNGNYTLMDYRNVIAKANKLAAWHYRDAE